MSRHARIEIVPVDHTRDEYHDHLARCPHYLRLVAANGAILMHSEAYSTRSNARRAAQAVAAAMCDATREVTS